MKITMVDLYRIIASILNNLKEKKYVCFTELYTKKNGKPGYTENEEYRLYHIVDGKTGEMVVQNFEMLSTYNDYLNYRDNSVDYREQLLGENEVKNILLNASFDVDYFEKVYLIIRRVSIDKFSRTKSYYLDEDDIKYIISLVKEEMNLENKRVRTRD